MCRAVGVLVVVTLCISTSARAQTSGWEASFAPATVSSWVTDNKPRVLVVGAGEASVLEDVEKHFVAALRDGGRTSLVMTDEVLGDVASLSDPEIVKKASSFPVDQIAVLRVFPSGDAPTAVVTFYGLDGKVLSALTAQRGTALAEKPSSGTTGHGVSNEAAAAVTEVTKSVPSASDAEEEYEKSYIGFDDVAVVNTQNGAVVSTQTLAYQGKYKKPLQGADFYQTVGRPDLVTKYNERSATRTVLMVGGGLGVVAGTAIMLLPLFDRETCSDQGWDQFDACMERQSASFTTSLYTGTGLMLGGAVLVMIGGFYNPHPVTPSEARELGDTYNKGLKTRLNLAANESKPERPRNDFTLAVSPVVGRNGGGVALRGTF